MQPNTPGLARFDERYYRRYYSEAATSVVTPDEARKEVRFVIAFCDHIGIDLRRFADVGAGTGWWAKEFARQRPTCRHIETFDASADAARLFGHRQVPIEKLGGFSADLVVCRDVLRYLPDRRARQGIRRLAKKCRGVLYLQIVTSDDEIDEDASDMVGYFRPVDWYLERLAAAGFTNAGMGLFVAGKSVGFDPFVLEVFPP